jgi:N-acetylmuramoyl-L-alanine amidase
MTKILSKEKWLKRRRRKRYAILTLCISLIMVFFAFTAVIAFDLIRDRLNQNIPETETFVRVLPREATIQLEYLTPNPYSRPQTSLKHVKSVVVHYTANPGTSAENNRNYFDNLAETHITYASSHFVIGLEGEIIQCLPLTEQSYASNDRNDDTISIECCHPDASGKFNESTYDALVNLTAGLCMEFNLGKEDIIRHYDVSGKKCPLYFVEHEDEWETFKEDVIKVVNSSKNAE